MNGYSYQPRPYPGNAPAPMENGRGDGMNAFDMDEGQSLDQIVSQNDKVENFRRRSMPVFANTRTQQMQMGSPDNRRVSMLNFGDPSDADDFQFDMQAAGMEGMMRNNPTFPRTTREMQSDRASAAGLAINTQFQGQNSPYPAMPAPGSAYASPMHQNGALDLDMSPYPNGIAMAMDMDDSLNMMPTDLNMFQNNHFSNSIMDSPIHQELVGPMPATSQGNSMPALQSHDRFKRQSLSNTPDAQSGTSGGPSRTSSQDQQSMRSLSRPQSEQHSSSKTSVPTQMSFTSLKNQRPIAQEPGQDLPKEKMNQINGFKLPWTPPSGGFPSTMHSNPHMKTEFKNAYSSTGFDMLGILVHSANHTSPVSPLTHLDACGYKTRPADRHWIR
jgi:hypothetical protein